jgi:putative ABC transport system substrate-binding protein
MRRREFIAGLGSAAAWPVVARAQQRAVPVIGVLITGTANDTKNYLVAFFQGLKETGYVEGQNVAVEYRYAENQYDRLPAFAADLVRRPVAVIVAGTEVSALAAKAATATIPIVFAAGGDPIALGLAASLNRPGGNVTGHVNITAELTPKRLQLLRELIPDAARFGVLSDPAYPTTNPKSQIWRRRHERWAFNSLLCMPAPIAISNRPSQLFRNRALMRSWSATAASSPGAWNNSRRWPPAMRYPRSTPSVSSLWPAA